jgi:hypothetical protein
MGRHARELERLLHEVDAERREAEATMVDIADKIATMDLDDDPGLVDRLQVERDACARHIERLGMRRTALENKRPEVERADFAELMTAAEPGLVARIEALAELVVPLDNACETIERALAGHQRLVDLHVELRGIRALATRAGLPLPPLPAVPKLSTKRLIAAREAVEKLAVVSASLDGGSIGAWALDGSSTIELLEELTPEAEGRAA